jgi:hypothetical protein
MGSFTKQELNNWNEVTFGEMLKTARNKNNLSQDQKSHFTKLLRRLRISNDFIPLTKREVTGYISKGWEDLNSKGPLIQKSLEATMELENWTPAEFLFNYYLDCFKFFNNHITTYDLGRSLRNLPSFLREYYIIDGLQQRGVSCYEPSPEVNANSHVDIIANVNGQEVFIWSYLNTDKSLFYLKKKLSTRGKINEGLNLLLPLQLMSDTENIDGWLMPSCEYIDNIVKALASDTVSYKDASTKLRCMRNFTLFTK